MDVYLLVSCKENSIEHLEFNVYEKFIDVSNEMKIQYEDQISRNNESIVSSNIGNWGARILFQYENETLPYVWSISKREITETENVRDKKYCAWTIEDPMSMYPEMTEDQAVAVMNLVERRADYDAGVTYGSIRDAVDCLYPDMKSADEYEEEDDSDD